MFPADCHKKPHLPLTFPQIGRWINKVCIISCSHGIFYDNFFLPWPSWSRNNEARCCIQPHAQMWWTLVVQNMTLNSFFYCLWLKGCVLPVCVCVCVKYWLRPCRSIDIHPRTPVNTRLPNPLMFNMIVDPLISTQLLFGSSKARSHTPVGRQHFHFTPSSSWVSGSCAGLAQPWGEKPCLTWGGRKKNVLHSKAPEIHLSHRFHHSHALVLEKKATRGLTQKK